MSIETRAETEPGRRGLSASNQPPAARGLLRVLVIALAALLVIGIAAAGGYVVGSGEEKLYAAQTEVIFEPGDTNVDLQEEMATQEVVVRSLDILGPVAEEFSVPIETLEETLAVEVVRGSRVLRLTVGHADPETARRLAEAIAQRYVEVTNATAQTSTTRTGELIAERIDAFTRRLSQVESRIDRAQAQEREDEVARLEAEQEFLLDRIGNLEDSLAEVQVVTSSAARTRVLTSAFVFDEPIRPRPLERAAAGALIGMVIAAAVAFVITRLWTVR